ncbi:MAG: hypothetical protein JXR84_10765 [Anaerolineae bacterium]|nr:hypothetical protein [Anaerolineae bacterium]
MRKYVVAVALLCKVLALMLAMVSMLSVLILQSLVIPVIALATGLAVLAMGSIVSMWTGKG